MSDDKLQFPPLNWAKSPRGFVDIYANYMHVTWTLDDVRVRIGQVVDSPETPNPGAKFTGIVEERAGVTFTWRNAKLLRDQLSHIIESYEQVNGEICVDVRLAPAPPSS